jgi:hypothetical protein
MYDRIKKNTKFLKKLPRTLGKIYFGFLKILKQPQVYRIYLPMFNGKTSVLGQ